MGACNCSIFCCTLLYVHSSITIILMGKRELVALLNLSFWCLIMVERLFLAVPRGCVRFVIVVFPDRTHLLFLVWMILILLSFKFVQMVTVHCKSRSQRLKIDFKMKTLKIFYFETTRPRALIVGM